MNIKRGTKKPILILVSKGNDYKRFSGKTMTNHVVADRVLTAVEVETFRRYPAAFVDPDLEPEAA